MTEPGPLCQNLKMVRQYRTILCLTVSDTVSELFKCSLTWSWSLNYIIWTLPIQFSKISESWVWRELLSKFWSICLIRLMRWGLVWYYFLLMLKRPDLQARESVHLGDDHFKLHLCVGLWWALRTLYWYFDGSTSVVDLAQNAAALHNIGVSCLNCNPGLIVWGAVQAPRGALRNLREGGRQKMCRNECYSPCCTAGGSEAQQD